MTNEEASKSIKYLLDVGCYSEHGREALTTAIKALEQQPCEDCISRQKALDCFEQTNTRQGAKYAIETLPSATPQRPKGKWIIKGDKEQGYDIAGVKTWYIQIMCDKCGFITTPIEGHMWQYHYCPNCGSYNGGGEDEDSD